MEDIPLEKASQQPWWMVATLEDVFSADPRDGDGTTLEPLAGADSGQMNFSDTQNDITSCDVALDLFPAQNEFCIQPTLNKYPLYLIPGIVTSTSRGWIKPATSDYASYEPTSDEYEEVLRLRIPSALQSAAQNRRQLRQRLFDLHFSTEGVPSPGMYTYDTVVAGPPRAIMTAAMDTLCLAQLATTYRDRGLMQEARSLYGKTICCLGHRLQLGSNYYLEDVLGAIHYLTRCAEFRDLAPSGKDWTKHVKLLYDLIKSHGWQSLSHSMRQTFFNYWKIQAFWYGLSQRAEAPFEKPSADLGVVDFANEDLTDLALLVPTMLRRTDRLLKVKKRPTRSAVLETLTELGNLVSALKQWHLKAEMAGTIGYRVVGIQNYEHFKDFCGPENIRTFPIAYNFKEAMQTPDFRTFCLCLLNTDQAILDLHKAFPEYCADLQLQLNVTESDAANCANDLCLSVPWNSQPHMNAYACHKNLQPLYYASRYYLRAGRVAQLDWCRHVSHALTEKYGLAMNLDPQ